eukprot:TRINITY_DN77772_c0_g1_i1.p1 TRINITY_DN77772_c0_g1~~TRINITY_DN77772_c0_g1_i1.p1  ORF type:complete len:160 (+),score=8.77 TRINITY_DN77772_c0_g1_i1:64-480(+)
MTTTPTFDTFFQEILSKFDGTLALIVSDLQGETLLKVTSPREPELGIINSQIASTFAMANEQGNKLLLGQTKHVILFYNKHVVCQLNCSPLAITLIADNKHDGGNVGILLNIMNKLEESNVLSCLVKAYNLTKEDGDF